MVEKILLKIRKNATCNRILGWLKKVNLDKISLRILNYYYYKHPTEEMKGSIVFFEKNHSRVLEVESLLADEKSKRVWKSLIEYRQTYNYAIHPGEELPQYFPADIVRLSTEEVFIDCGGYIGDTAMEFIKQCHGNYKDIVIFEPEKGKKEELERNLYGYKYSFYQGGVWDKNTTVGLKTDQGGASYIVELEGKAKNANAVIPVYAIDECVECADASYIKMDIEGSEMKALQGAQKTIVRNKPKLAICIYHSDEDMLQIIEYVHALVPEYKIYVRHHSNSWIETVMYAIP